MGLPFISTIVDRVAAIVEQMVEDKDLSKRLIAGVRVELMDRLGTALEKELAERARIIASEASGQSWLQRNWRPITMLVFVYIIAHNYIVAPLFSVKSLPIPPHMWELLKLGIGGYIIGRSAEKILGGTLPGIARLWRERL